MGLDEYREKRDFRKTPEPSGDGKPSSRGELAYVVQKHDASSLHYDFRLELEGTLKSWAVPKGPSLEPGVKRLAMRTEDHPLSYGEFEGVIPEGEYGGGTVMLWDRGTWAPEGDPVDDLRNGTLRFTLDGEKLSGGWILTRMKKKASEKESWLLIKSRDGAARENGEREVTEEKPLSVATGRTLQAIAGDQDRVWTGAGEGDSQGRGGSDDDAAGPEDPSGIDGARRGRLPTAPKAQLATLVADPPEGDGWIHEMKLDGYRVLAVVRDGEARIITRNGKDWTARFPGIAEALAELRCESTVVDGEVVVLDREGRTSFQMLQNSLAGAREGEPLLYAFDLLYLDGWDLRDAALLDRRRRLRPLLGAAPVDRLRYSDHVRGQGPAFFERACRMGVEGMISKRADAPYRGGRSRDWLKVKCTARQELVVVGYTDPSGSRVGFGALLLASHDADGRLVYAGKVGTGFDDRTLMELGDRLEAIERETPPVVDPPEGRRARGVHWVRPELVAEIEFTEWTEDGRIRHPSFQGLREDKAPEDVLKETTQQRAGVTGSETQQNGELRVAGVRVTSPDRVLWAEQGVTKRELVEYYVAIEEAVLPRLVDRPLTLVRCPSGAEENCFFQKHANDSVPDAIPRVPIEEEEGSDLYLYVNGLPSLVALVQLGTLELHVWGSRRDRLDRPDRLVFDLDPDEGLAFGRVAAAALRLRELLGDLGLESFPKTTGGKGLHVVVPVTRRSDWAEAKGFAQAVARRMVADDPDGFTAKMSKRRRTGRIFVDYLRNARNATAIADYSTRARPGAPVAVPLAWDEVDPRARKAPRFTVREVPDRVAEVGDPWEGAESLRQSITAPMREALGLE